MARKTQTPKMSTGAYQEALVDLYVKLIPIEDRKKRMIGNLSADHGGREASAIDEAAFAEATRRLTTPKSREPAPSAAPGFEGTPMGSFLGEDGARADAQSRAHEGSVP